MVSFVSLLFFVFFFVCIALSDCFLEFITFLDSLCSDRFILVTDTRPLALLRL